MYLACDGRAFKTLTVVSYDECISSELPKKSASDQSKCVNRKKKKKNTLQTYQNQLNPFRMDGVCN